MNCMQKLGFPQTIVLLLNDELLLAYDQFSVLKSILYPRAVGTAMKKGIAPIPYNRFNNAMIFKGNGMHQIGTR